MEHAPPVDALGQCDGRPSTRAVSHPLPIPGTSDMSHLAKKYRRDASKRIFVCRSLQMKKVKFFGFDMDYTLAVYKSPEYENLGFERVIERLISNGYPEVFREFKYRAGEVVRGLWFDQWYGNLLKVDAYGNILMGRHGYRFLHINEIEEFYPNKHLNLINGRVYVLNTLFNLPETWLLASVVNYFDGLVGFVQTKDKRGVCSSDMSMSYQSLFQDVRAAVDWVHMKGDLKAQTVAEPDKYIEKDGRLAELLPRLRSQGAKIFLVTNSDFAYSNKVMTYLLGDQWRGAFDFVVVDARKPLWFAEGTVLRQVDTDTGALRIGRHMGPMRSGQVYAGGGCDEFTRMLGARGKDVLYVGDHIFGDVLRSKKARGWRTFLIVPELHRELSVWRHRRGDFNQLQRLDIAMGEAYKNLDLTAPSAEQPDITHLASAIRDLTQRMDGTYSTMGSLFRSGSRTTFFASQVERYADLYSGDCCNLLYYPSFYFFRAPPMLLPHESTVEHEDEGGLSDTDSLPLPPTPLRPSFVHEDNDDSADRTQSPPSRSSSPESCAASTRPRVSRCVAGRSPPRKTVMVSSRSTAGLDHVSGFDDVLAIQPAIVDAP